VRTEQEYRSLFRYLTLAGGMVSFVLLLAMAIDRPSHDDWQGFQRAFRDSLRARAATAGDSIVAEPFVPEIRQVSLGADERVDRCITCHLGTVLPAIEGLPQPLGGHSGEHLVNHPVDRFGCTLCHGGNGRDVAVQAPCTAASAGGYSIESLRYIQSSCGRCHTPAFDTSETPGAAVLERGRARFHTGGCLGCHRLRMVGGTLGPDLTEQGAKSLSHYSFRYIEGNRSIPTWLREHFRDPAGVSPGSVMPPVGGSTDDLDALLTFVLSLHPIGLPAEYYSLPVLAESRGNRPGFDGSTGFGLFCSACHGGRGGGTPYDSSSRGAPALGGVGFQAIASDEFIQFALMEGRGTRLMASWRPILSGLRPEELEGILTSIRRWKAPVRRWEDVRAAAGSAVKGSRLFDSKCAPCHGAQREGGIGPRLRNPDFLRLATDLFLYATIAAGRRNTAMPSWSQLTDEEILSLVLFLRGATPYSYSNAARRSSLGDSARGGRMFASYCSRCHGAHGEGGIGPAILNPDFLAAADDAFLAGTIKRGRAHTPMFGWSQAGVRLSAGDVSSIIGYMRATAERPPERIYPGAVLGRPQRGREIFRELCSGCHGVNGEGTKGPALNNQEFLNAASNGFLVATITLGRPGTAMPSWGQPSPDRSPLSQTERLDLVAFIRVWQTDVIDRSWVRASTHPPQAGVAPVISRSR